MKRTIALLIAAFLLFSGCAKALPDAEPEPITPVETKQPIQAIPPINPEPLEEEPPELMNSEERCAEIMEYLNEICDVADKSGSRLLYAQYSLPDDWMIGANVPIKLYQYPYNIDSIQPYNASGDFMSNTEVLNAYKAEIIDDLIALARAVGEFHANANGDSFEKDPYTQSAVASICPELLLEDVRTFKEYDLTNSFITEGKFLSDR